MKNIIVVLIMLFAAGCASLNKENLVEAKLYEPQPKKEVKEPEITSSHRVSLKKAAKTAQEEPQEALDMVDEANIKAVKEPEDFIYGMTVYDYVPYTLYRVYCSPGKVTDIVLAPGEELIDIAAGDTSRWQLNTSSSGKGDEQRVHVILKPVEPYLTNNIIILTSMYSYHLEVQSTEESYQSAVSWNYPKSFIQKAKKPSSKEPEPDSTTVIKDAAKMSFNYEITDTRGWFERRFGPRIGWMPVRVFDDGHKTFIQFPPDMKSSEAPALFVLSPEGSTQLVNYRVSGFYYIVDRLFHKARLVVGQKNPVVVKIRKES
jgi:type IV secretion system protein VirB9